MKDSPTPPSPPKTEDGGIVLLCGDALAQLLTLPDASVHCCVTSPPYYGLRDYGVDGQIGLERTPEEYIARLVAVFREVRRVLRDDGTLWVNIGDSYASAPPGNKTLGVSGKSTLHGVNGLTQAYRETLAAGHATKRDTSKLPGLKPKDLIGIPWMLAFALRADGWWLRQDIIWHKPNPMPESVKDRCTKAHEYVFMFSKSARYWYDAAAVAEEATHDNREFFRGADSYTGGNSFNNSNKIQPSGRGHIQNKSGTRNRRSVWTFATLPTPEAHFATYPIELPETCILAGCPEGGTVLDPFNGAGTTGLAALKNGRKYIGIELNTEYIEITRRRLAKFYPLLIQEAV